MKRRPSSGSSRSPAPPSLAPSPASTTPIANAESPEDHQCGSSGAFAGLAPSRALVWLRLQRVFAWTPEAIAGLLEEGMDPERILARHGTGRLHATDKVGQESGVEGVEEGALERDIGRLEAAGVRVVPRGDPAYPERLEPLRDAPPVLLVRGDALQLRCPAVAIVGARAATAAARRTARSLGRDLAAAGFSIVSGLARGIDSEAHRGALEARGVTIAVLACGPDRIYPPENRGLAEEIARTGAVVTEMPVGVEPRRAHFPLRNRLISGLSIAVIVVEARRRSGSLITVRHALNQGREVFVVPGATEGPFAEGSNALLREGARPVRSASDVVEDLAGSIDLPALQAQREKGRRVRVEAEQGSGIDGDAAAVLRVLEDGPLSREQLFTRIDLEGGLVARALVELELRGSVIEDRDGRLRRTWA